MRRQLLTRLLLASLCLAMPGFAQEDEPPSFVDRVDVNVVNVEVFVTDSSGQRVGDLTKEDFEIWIDGKPVEVSNFYAVVKAATGAPPALTSPGDTQQETEPEPQTSAQERRLHLVIFVDHANLRAANRQRVLNELETFLEERAAAGDLLMLVSHNQGLKVETPFTDQLELLSQGLESMRRAPAQGDSRVGEKRILRRRITQSFLDGDPGAAASFFRQYQDIVRAETRRSTNALESMVRSLSSIPGRKALVYVSGGIEARPGADLEEQFFGGGSRTRDDGADPFRQITHQANAAQVTFYTLDAQGVQGGTSSAEFSDDQAGGFNRANVDAIRTQNLQAPLVDMAEATGGSSFLNTFNVEGSLDEMTEDFGSFYSLGYTVAEEGDGKFHRVEVKVGRPGLKVRHRSGFFAKSAREQVADRTLSSLLLARHENALGISVQLGQLQEKRRGRFQLPIIVHIPADGVTVLPQGDKFKGQLRIFIAVQDAEGGVSTVHDIPYPLEIPATQLRQALEQDLGYQTRLETRPGEQTIAIGVWDEISGIESYARTFLKLEDATPRKKRRRAGS